MLQWLHGKQQQQQTNASTHLHLYGLAVDKLAAGDHRVKDDRRLLARVQDDVVALATVQIPIDQSTNLVILTK